MESARSFVLGVALVAVALVVSRPSFADAPHPVEAGEFYVEGSLSLQNFDRPDFSQFQMYRDDSSQTASGKITTANDAGDLILINLKQKKEVIPEGTIGYSFESELFDGFGGNVRAEVTGSMWNTNTRGSQASATPPANGFFIKDLANPGAYIEVGLFTAFPAIDGRDFNADGTEAGLLTQRTITGITLDVDEEQWRGGFMFYLDERFGGWESSRGFGILYSYHTQDSLLRFDMPSLLGDPDIAASIGNDATYRYDYDITSHSLLFPFDFSLGHEVFAGISLFVGGTATIGLIVNDLDARQEGPCLTVCNFTTAPFDYSRGVVKHRRSDAMFGYDTRGGGGVSWRIWKLRVTGEAGAFYTNQYSEPDEIEAWSPLQTRTVNHWGYFGKATATVIF